MIVLCMKWPRVGDKVRFNNSDQILSSWHNSTWKVHDITQEPRRVLSATFSSTIPPAHRWEMVVVLELIEAPHMAEVGGFLMNGVRLRKSETKVQPWMVIKEVNDDEARVVQKREQQRVDREAVETARYEAQHGSGFGRIALRGEEAPSDHWDYGGEDA